MSDDPRLALRLAYEADICLNTAKKALKHGADAVKGSAGRRAAEAAKRIGLELGTKRDGGS